MSRMYVRYTTFRFCFVNIVKTIELDVIFVEDKRRYSKNIKWFCCFCVYLFFYVAKLNTGVRERDTMTSGKYFQERLDEFVGKMIIVTFDDKLREHQTYPFNPEQANANQGV